MVAISKRVGGSFTVEIKHNFGPGNEDLLSYLVGLDEKIRRDAVRRMVRAAGSELAKEIRLQIKRRDMPFSRARNAAERRKARKQSIKPLLRTIGTKVYSKPRRGIIGAVVGPQWPAGAHGHLVEFGHKITGRARFKFTGLSIRHLLKGRLKKKTVRLGRRKVLNAGMRTVAHEFQQEAMGNVESRIFASMAQAMARALKKYGLTPKTGGYG